MNRIARYTILGAAGALLLSAATASLAPAESKPQDPAVSLLQEILTDSLWEWDGELGERIRFRADGTVEHRGREGQPTWEARGLVTSWKVIDAHTVLFRIEEGRNCDRYAILIFDDDYSGYSGHNFHRGSKLATSRPLPPDEIASVATMSPAILSVSR